MKNKVMKNLIILGIVAFAFIFANNASAYSCMGYSCQNSYAPYYNSYNSSYNNSYQDPSYLVNQNTTPGTSIVIYPPAPTAYYGYQPVVNNTPTQTEPKVVNNYYYQNVPASTVAKTNTTSTTTNNTTTNTTPNMPANTGSNGAVINGNTGSNGLGASAYNGYNYGSSTGNGITALSLRGSGSFMPSSVWQWMFVIILILVIIIVARMFVHKPSPSDHDVHVTTHTH